MIPLKEATSIKHKQAERMPFNVRMFPDNSHKDQYALYLNQQPLIFQTIEKLGLPKPQSESCRCDPADLAEPLKNGGHASTIVLDATRSLCRLPGIHDLRTSTAAHLPHYMAPDVWRADDEEERASSGKIYDFDNVQEAIQSIRAAPCMGGMK